MRIMIAVVFLLTNIIIFSAGFSPCFSQEQVQVVQPLQLEGVIAYVDFIGSTITIRYLQLNGNHDEITLKVTSHTKVDRGNLRIPLTDANEGDEVIVEYYDDPVSLGAPKVSQINIIPST